MAWWSWVEGLAGLWLACVTLRDVFETVVVPGGTKGTLRASRRFARVGLPLAKFVRHRGIGVNFAPIILVAAFLLWMFLLVLAFGLMTHATASTFTPEITSFGHALYLAGGAMTTMGMGESEPHGVGAVVSVAGGFTGLAVMTMGVTYLLEVQSNIGHRDAGVLKITTSAGRPPSALALLERYASLGTRDELLDIVRSGRDWCATVLQSHASHPSLIYFRSAGTGSGWPATLGALIDLALLLELVVDEPGLAGSAILMREQAMRLSDEMSQILGLEPVQLPDASADLPLVCARLAAAGYQLRPQPDPQVFARRRQEEAAPAEALSRHLGLPGAPLLPPPR